ncbi:YgfZ/GcvT domain-containing protein [Pistricoccus aurantiacus]|uniref:CAF17-like 4Fe-4S cluster assembly/insertion protein YgfZ n=1 Tax=Pistricoccus aurantiacus TaxID=1883414 RepID=UPI0036449E83
MHDSYTPAARNAPDAPSAPISAQAQARLALDNTVSMELEQLGVLEISGTDAVKFLQGQTSAQVTLADGDFAPLTCFCSPKGRMLANAQLMQVEEGRLWLIMPRELREELKNHLAKFAVFYKVEIQPRDDLALLGLIGNNAPLLVESRLDIVPPALWRQAGNAHIQVLRHPGPRPRLLICLADASKDAIKETLANQATPVDPGVWELQDIKAGLAWLSASQRDTYLPQMINWEALGGISFKKGCYTGQEVVARAHFRGQVKKRLARAQLEGDALPAIGAAMIDAQGKRQGEVFKAQLDAYGQVEILAVLTTKELAEPLTVNDLRVKRLKLPYALERVDPEELAAQG